MPDAEVLTSNGTDEANLTTNGEIQQSKLNSSKLPTYMAHVNTFPKNYQANNQLIERKRDAWMKVMWTH